MSENLPILTIVLPPFFEPTHECCMCGTDCRPEYGVAYCCGPTHDPIGSMSSEYEGTGVGGMTACKMCHDRHYGLLPVPDLNATVYMLACEFCDDISLGSTPQMEFEFPLLISIGRTAKRLNMLF